MNRKKEWKKAGFRKIQRESKASPNIMYLERLKKKSKNFLRNVGLNWGTLSLALPDLFFASIGLRLPLIQAYIVENSLIILIFYSTFLLSFFIRLSKQEKLSSIILFFQYFSLFFLFQSQAIINNYSYVLTTTF